MFIPGHTTCLQATTCEKAETGHGFPPLVGGIH